VLGHADRLRAAGVPRGFFRRLGRSGALIRQIELEADRFAILLVSAAGFDPGAGSGFWRRLGGRSRGLRLFPTHPGGRARAREWEEAMASAGR